MLSRAASSLYWIGRHIERADFTARLIDAAQKFDLLPNSDGISGMKSAFEASGAIYICPIDIDELSRDEMIKFLSFDEANPSSIYSCLTKARNDARSIRTAFTREVFEVLNENWLNLSSKKSKMRTQDINQFVANIEEIARGFDGALQRTMLRGEQLWFVRLGAALERADNTARLLDVKYHILLPETDGVGGAIDHAQWTAILRSVSAETSYRWLYRDGLTSWHVAEFLILREEMPRSLAACISEVNEMLAKLRKQMSRQSVADRQARVCAEMLSKNNIDTIFEKGLHEFLVDFIAANNKLGNSVAEQFLF